MEVRIPMKKIRMKKRKGVVSLFAIGAFVVISVLTFYIIAVIKNDIYQMHAYRLQMQAQFLADEATSAAVSALLMDDTASLLDTTDWSVEILESTMDHIYHNQTIGQSHITMQGAVGEYYHVNKDWIVITVNTTLEDPRPENTTGQFTYMMTAVILKDNPLIQIYNIDPDVLLKIIEEHDNE